MRIVFYPAYRFIILIAVALGFSLGTAQFALAQKEVVQKPLSKARIQFTEKQHDFGDLVQGESVTYKFAFQNTGTEPLMILNVQTTCGCTAPEWPKKPIPPGEGGEIVVTFNSAKKMGRVNKIITVYTNGEKPEEKLKIVTNVLPAAADAPAPEKPIKVTED
jgi:hypothetical protein